MILGQNQTHTDEQWIMFLYQEFDKIRKNFHFLFDLFNDTCYTDTCSKKMLLYEIEQTMEDLDNNREDVETYLEEDYINSDDEYLHEIIRETTDISEFHYKKLKEIVIEYFVYERRITRFIRSHNDPN